VANIYLIALLGAVAGARLFHVLLNWNYFADALNEITMISLGGLDWHGAVLGGIVGLLLVLKIQNFVGTRRALSLHIPSAPEIPSFHALLDALTPALPLVGLAGWWGCLAASCGYGTQVDNLSHYPAFAVAETADVYGIVVPRYNTQNFGLILSAVVLLVVALLFWRGWLRYRRFWLTLFALSVGMFVIGFFRGDHALIFAGLRADQLLDLLFAAGAVIALVFTRPPPVSSP
jgi:phosphatidylglycerol:prolipoprotein diacylglycerol transferase